MESKFDLLDAICRVAHEANAAFCRSIGDDSQPSWDQAPDWQKDSCKSGVEAIIGNPLLTPEESHQNWLAYKKNEGWVYGEVKDPSKKEHPCMVPYEDLPAEDKVKDYLFRNVVLSFLPFIKSVSYQDPKPH